MKKYKVICPLINFRIPNIMLGPHKMTDEEVTDFFKKREKQLVEGINIVEGVKIRRMSKEDLEDLKSSFFLPSDMRELISPNKFVLEKYITVRDDHDFQLDKIMRNIVLGLRLLKGGHVFGNYRLYFLLSKEKKQLESWSREDGHILEDSRAYALKFEEISPLRKIVKKLQSIDISKRRSLRLACSRFQRAYEESDVEDQLIDLIIAFEALFLKGEKATRPAGQIIAIACSVLLGKNDEEREKIRNLLIQAYSIRNCIVHGAEYRNPHIKGEEYRLLDFVSVIEDHLRESIKKLLH